jgi:hypothetical protein
MRQQNHRGTKHIQAKAMIINYHVENGDNIVEHVAGVDNPSDHFTKKHRATIMGKPSNDQFLLSKPVFS